MRLSLSTVKGISEEQVTRIAAGQPYNGLQDLWQHGRPALPTAERLVQVGAFDSLRGPLTRRDLLLQTAELHRHTAARPADGQLPLDGHLVTAEPSGLPEMTSRETLDAELSVLRIDVSQHLMEHHHRLLREIGATDSAHLKAMHPGQQVLVAGVRASTQTPPIPSGKRVISVTLEDGFGLCDIAFFDDSHDAVPTPSSTAGSSWSAARSRPGGRAAPLPTTSETAQYPTNLRNHARAGEHHRSNS